MYSIVWQTKVISLSSIVHCPLSIVHCPLSLLLAPCSLLLAPCSLLHNCKIAQRYYFFFIYASPTSFFAYLFSSSYPHPTLFFTASCLLSPILQPLILLVPTREASPLRACQARPLSPLGISSFPLSPLSSPPAKCPCCGLAKPAPLIIHNSKFIIILHIPKIRRTFAASFPIRYRVVIG